MSTKNEIQKTQDRSITYRPRQFDDEFKVYTDYKFTSPFVNSETNEDDEYTRLYNEENENFDYDGYNASRKKLPKLAWAWSIMFFIVFFPTNLSFLIDPPGEVATSSFFISLTLLFASIVPLSIMLMLRYMRS